MNHPRLPFGNFDFVVNDSLDNLRHQIAKAVPGEFDIDEINGDVPFWHAISTAKFGKLTLTAIGTTPIRLDRKSETTRTIVIPISGDMNVSANGKKYRGHAGETGLFFSGQPRIGIMDNGLSELLVDIDSQYLLEVAKAMVGPDCTLPANALHLDQDRELPLTHHGVSFDALIRAHCRVIDGMRHQPDALAMLGLDNTFYRSFVALLAPSLVFGMALEKPANKTVQRQVLDQVCDHIQANLGHPITLTELEQISGLSARSLQYAFMRRFGSSPMAWIRQERLALARDLLSKPNLGATVVKVAVTAGFNHLGKFSQDYRKRYGESPSDTLKRATNGRS